MKRRKIIIILGVVIILVVMGIVAINHIERRTRGIEGTEVKDYKLVYITSMEKAPVGTLSLYDEVFTFINTSSSDLDDSGIQGTYVVEEDTLILVSEDGANTYYFHKDGEDWIFDATKSSPIENVNWELVRTVKDGTRFEFFGRYELE